MRHNLNMATWQFDVHLIPRCKLQQVFGFIPHMLDKEAFDATNWWQNVALPTHYRELLSALVPFNASVPFDASSCEDIELWGDMEGDRVEVCRHEGEIDSVYVRINVTDLNTAFINGISSFAQACDCLIFTEDKRLLEPSADLLDKAVLQSNAARFVANPRASLDNLEANGVEP
jgi:hypothetical protein